MCERISDWMKAPNLPEWAVNLLAGAAIVAIVLAFIGLTQLVGGGG